MNSAMESRSCQRLWSDVIRCPRLISRVATSAIGNLISLSLSLSPPLFSQSLPTHLSFRISHSISRRILHCPPIVRITTSLKAPSLTSTFANERYKHEALPVRFAHLPGDRRPCYTALSWHFGKNKIRMLEIHGYNF